MFPYIYDMGQRIKTAVEGLAADWLFLAGFSFGGGNIAAASDTAVHAAVTLGAEAQDVTTLITSPVVPRNITVKGSQAGITGNVVITGTNYKGEAITETIALSGASSVAGNYAFKTVTKVSLPALTGEGDTVSVGTGSKLGLPWLLSRNVVLKAYLDNALEGTAPTVTIDATDIHKNTVTLASALNNKPVYAILALP